MPRSCIRFLRDQRMVQVDSMCADTTLLDWLRLDDGATGTKEGCAEGDCGACTVVIGVADQTDRRVDYFPVTSCIQLLGMMDGKQIISVDDLADGDGGLHPVQQAMYDQHASQCGFCTPGFVMSLFALYHRQQTEAHHLDRQQINDALAGNLCRCTGYRPIVSAAFAACRSPQVDRFSLQEQSTLAQLISIRDREDLFVDCGEGRFFAAPASTESLLALIATYPDATLVGGATDVGLWINKSLIAVSGVVHTGRIEALQQVTEDDQAVHIGGAATYSQARRALSSIDPDVAEVLRRLGSTQIRAAGTIGGNIANGSPIGDMAPMLIALDASIEIRSSSRIRTLALEEFFIEYGKQDLATDELLTAVTIPKLSAAQHFRAFKISKRSDQDISSLLGAVCLTIDSNRIVAARIAFGGMAGTPKRAVLTEQALHGVALDDERACQRATETVRTDYEPLSDMRAGAQYRRQTAVALLQKALYEIGSNSVDNDQQTRLNLTVRQAADV